MTARTVAILWIVALLLAGVWWALPDPSAGFTTRGTVVHFEEADVSRLDVRTQEGAELTVEHEGDAWVLREADGPGWPVEGSHVRALLRLVLELGDEGPYESEFSATAALTVHDETGTPTVIEFGGAALAGRVPVRVTRDGSAGSAVLTSNLVPRALTRSGLLGWRPGPIFGLDPSTADLLELTGQAGSISLGRRGGRWMLQRPAIAPADVDSVRSALSRLGLMRITRYVDDETDDREPLATVALSAGARRDSLELLGANPEDADRIRARLSRSGSRGEYGPVLVELDRSSLNDLPAAAEAFLQPRALDTPASDVGTLVLARGVQGDSPPMKPSQTQESLLVARRTLDGWSRAEGGQDRRALSTGDLERLVELATSPADGVRVVEPGLASPALVLDLYGLGGGPLTRLRLEPTPSGVELSSGSVRYTHRGEDAEDLSRRLRRLVSGATGGD